MDLNGCKQCDYLVRANIEEIMAAHRPSNTYTVSTIAQLWRDVKGARDGGDGLEGCYLP
jgi:hypothetical protein